MADMHDQLIDLQTRVAYHEDTIAQLNDVITRQDADIVLLQQQLRILAKRLDELHFDQGQDAAESSDQRPPHY